MKEEESESERERELSRGNLVEMLKMTRLYCSISVWLLFRMIFESTMLIIMYLNEDGKLIYVYGNYNVYANQWRNSNNYSSSFKMCQRHRGTVEDSHYFSNHIQFEWHQHYKCKFLCTVLRCVVLCCATPN